MQNNPANRVAHNHYILETLPEVEFPDIAELRLASSQLTWFNNLKHHLQGRVLDAARAFSSATKQEDKDKAQRSLDDLNAKLDLVSTILTPTGYEDYR